MNHKRKCVDSLGDQIALLSNHRRGINGLYVPDGCPGSSTPALPPELWAKVFSYLDDFSLWSVSHVSVVLLINFMTELIQR
jgi:hypothetical protein